MDSPYDWEQEDDAPKQHPILAPLCKACGQQTVVFFKGGICQKCAPYYNAYKEGDDGMDLLAGVKEAPDFAFNPLERLAALNPTVDAMVHGWAEHGITELEGWLSDKS